MAVVAEASGNGGGAVGAGPEQKLGHVNRTVSAVHGSATPEYIGEIVTDVAADQNYVGKRADGDFNTDALGTSDWAKCD
jgi:hypothetical protein